MSIFSNNTIHSKFNLLSTSIVLTCSSIAVIIGLALSMLPPNQGIPLSFILTLSIYFFIAAAAPVINVIPEKALSYGFCFTIFLYFVWPRNAFLPIQGLPVKHPQRLCYLLFLSYWFYLFFKCSKFRERIYSGLNSSPWLSWSWLGLITWQFISNLYSGMIMSSVSTWIMDLIVIYILYPVVISCCKDTASIQRIIKTLIAAALLNCLFAIPEFFLNRNLFEKFITLDTLDPIMAKQILSAKYRGGSYRAQASFDHPLLFAEYLSLILPFLLVLLNKGKLRNRLTTLGGIGLILIGLFLSRSRVAFAATLITISSLTAVYIWHSASGAKKNPKALVITILTLPIIASIVFYSAIYISDLSSGRSFEEASSSAARSQMFFSSIGLIFNEPIFGYGQGAGAATLNFRNPSGIVTLDNYYLILALDNGIPVLIFFISIGLALIFNNLYRNNTHSQDLINIKVSIFACAIAFYAVKAILGTALNFPILGVIAGITAAIAAQQLAIPNIKNTV